MSLFLYLNLNFFPNIYILEYDLNLKIKQFQFLLFNANMFYFIAFWFSRVPKYKLNHKRYLKNFANIEMSIEIGLVKKNPTNEPSQVDSALKPLDQTEKH